MGRDKKKQYNRIYAQNSSSINSLKRQQVYPASATATGQQAFNQPIAQFLSSTGTRKGLIEMYGQRCGF